MRKSDVSPVNLSWLPLYRITGLVPELVLIHGGSVGVVNDL